MGLGNKNILPLTPSVVEVCFDSAFVHRICSLWVGVLPREF